MKKIPRLFYRLKGRIFGFRLHLLQRLLSDVLVEPQQRVLSKVIAQPVQDLTWRGVEPARLVLQTGSPNFHEGPEEFAGIPNLM